MSYVPLSPDWKYDPHRAHRQNNWKVGMLFYRQARKEGLQDASLNELSYSPGAVDPNDPGQPAWLR